MPRCVSGFLGFTVALPAAGLPAAGLPAAALFTATFFTTAFLPTGFFATGVGSAAFRTLLSAMPEGYAARSAVGSTS
ncbi:hypothetical protein GCM10010505_60520 [Kitasatospora aburaviensis]